MSINDSFFDNILVVMNQNVNTYNKPQTICKSLERTFAVCNNPTKRTTQYNHTLYQDDNKFQKHQTNQLDYYLKQQNKTETQKNQSKSYRSIKQQELNNQTSIPQKTYLKQQMRLKINLENDAFQSNLRHKTQSIYNTTNPFQGSITNLMKQQMQKQQQSFLNIHKTMNDDSKMKISSTHRQSLIPSKLTQRQDSQNIRKSNSVYMQEFRKVFHNTKYSIHNYV
ncbi:unnamed protein product [Paramecium sonneborni]|uniref:Uncharacterized protein n=1 Tax=Paramecium sonneborni TaxID=65129 RepID=A0A8S1L5A7_9CILI|nr:unnamed protein product [Paramecium sonneborni]